MSSTRVHRPIRTYTQSERAPPSTAHVPYGCYKYESAKNYLPGGLFHFVKDEDSYVPTIHGLSADSIRTLKEVAGSVRHYQLHCEQAVSEHATPVRSGADQHGTRVSEAGDRFTVQLPNKQDVAAQLDVDADQGYNMLVNKGIWGGLLTTRRVNCDCGGDPVEEVIQAIKQEHDFDVFQLISPYTPQSILSMMTLVANGGGYHQVGDAMRKQRRCGCQRGL
ncbi:hypothetical protein DPEC_G00067830 [Dallia pectoralis]|uniref:Uncharacterized protein n=1 Tax=Dallia pectoralis TaxID=75939 RepID=A0ACC2H237_DALPE|nr:hypothetical protein DPEC_G00067830 [Dallia pectoralis]